MVRQQDDLPFDFRGFCNTFTASEEKALLCFGRDNPKQCHL